MWYLLVVRPSKIKDKWKICESKWDDHDPGWNRITALD